MIDIKYKYATWILGLGVIVLAVMLALKPAPSASDQLNEAQASLTNCVERLASWRTEMATSSSARADLDEILNGCQNDLENVSQAI